MSKRPFAVDLVKDDRTETLYEQLSLISKNVVKCDECKRDAKLPTIMRWDDKTYQGHLYCMKKMRSRLEGKSK